MATPDRLVTRPFLVLCAFSFATFVSAFQLLPVAPFRILRLGGTELAAGLFLASLTYASACSAPFTGALADRVGTRRVIDWATLAIAAVSIGYALSPRVDVLLVLAFVHGVFWSGLLSSSAAYSADIIPAHRRAEGLGYWGLASLLAIAAAPPLGLWLYRQGWPVLCASVAGSNLVMIVLARQLPGGRPRPTATHARWSEVIDWRVLLAALTLFLVSFGYGGVTSFVALYAQARHVTPSGLYFTTFASAMILTRPMSGQMADRLGHRNVLLPCLALVAAGYALLARAETRAGFVVSAIVFGVGFGAVYPVFAAYMLRLTDPARRGATFGSLLAAFDTGIGSGSMIAGWLVARVGYGPTYGLAAVAAALAIPYFLFAERVVRRVASGHPRVSMPHPDEHHAHDEEPDRQADPQP